MGGRKTFQNCGLLSPIRYRQLFEDKGISGETLRMVENPKKLKNKDVIYIFCRFCGHKQKIAIGEELRDELNFLKDTSSQSCLNFIFNYSKKITPQHRNVVSPNGSTTGGKAAIDSKPIQCSNCCKKRLAIQFDKGKPCELLQNGPNFPSVIVQSPLRCCGRMLYFASGADLAAILASNKPDILPPLPERVDSLLNREEQKALQEAPWFQAGISREIALDILGRQRVGSFLVRNSTSKPGCYALSLRVPQEFRPKGIANYLILETIRGFKIKGFTKEFSSLTALIIHHSVMPELLPCPLLLTGNRKFQFDSTDFLELSLDNISEKGNMK